MRVIVTGMVATYPVAGVAFDYLQYAQGFRALGCDVHYLEDTGHWFYDPAAETFVPGAAHGTRFLATAIEQLVPELSRAWTVRDGHGTLCGPGATDLETTCASTDMLLNVSGSCWLREPYRTARVAAYVDTDPGYSQAKLAAVADGTADAETIRSAALIRRHSCFFTLAEAIGRPGCRVPTLGLTWHPTRAPIVLDDWRFTTPPLAAPFTTIMSWKIEPEAPVVDGERFGGKDVEFERIVDLPARVGVPLEVAISGPAPRERLAAAGWQVTSARRVSDTLEAYRGYIQRSLGEFSVAKNVYVATGSGWFSTRSASYLASGRPVVVQDTGFSAHLPSGPGLHPFRTADDAAAGLEAVLRDPVAAGRHAREIAAEHFDARRICERLLVDAGV